MLTTGEGGRASYHIRQRECLVLYKSLKLYIPNETTAKMLGPVIAYSVYGSRNLRNNLCILISPGVMANLSLKKLKLKMAWSTESNGDNTIGDAPVQESET